MKKIILLLPLLLLHLLVFSQKEWSNWYSNGTELLTFKNGIAEKVNNFINPIPPVPPYTNIYNFYYNGRGGISYSDPVTGDMKFIISQRLGYGTDYKDFPNDTFIRSCPDQKSYHIIPFHNDPNKFYVIQFQSAAADLLAAETGLQVRCPNAIGLAYSIVDLSKNGGLGDITSINNFITGRLTEQITLVRHANTKDVWIIVHPYGTAQYHAILVTDNGFQPAVASNIGVAVNGGYKTSLGDITASHDGKLLAGCRSLTQNSGSESDIELFDFDNATGQLSNYRTMPSSGHVTKLQFSPDNSKLYSIAFDDDYGMGMITQWDFNQPNVAASKTVVEALQHASFWDMQLAPDGKIYISSFQESVGNNYYNYLVAIQCPNLQQFACNIEKRAIDISSPAFPDLINDFINVPKVPLVPKFSIGNDTAICFGSLTLTAPTGWQSYKWNTGETTQSITVKKAGLYYVLTGSTGFSCPTGYGYINVTDKAIKLDLGKDSGLCANTSYHLHIPASYTNILWENGSHARDSVLYGGGNTIIAADDVNGCYSNDTINVYYKYDPKAAFGKDTVLCNSETLTLQLQPYKVFSQGAIYTWQDNSTDDHFVVNKPGTYWGKVSYAGCAVSDTIQVSYISAQQVSIGNDTTLCMGDSLLLTSSIANAIYRWSTGETGRSIYVKNSGDYRISVTNGSCTVMDTIHVSFNAKPIVSLGNDTTLCERTSLQLTPAAGYGNYLWQDGSTGNRFTVTKAGTYWLKFSDNGCTVVDTIYVSFKNLPTLDLGKDTGFCSGSTVKLNAFDSSIQSYTWQDRSILSSYVAAATGNYSVTVTGTNGCKNQDTVLLTMLPQPVFSLGNDTAICDGKVLSLQANNAGASYLWNDGSTGNQFFVRSPGTYWLSVNDKGCSKTDSIAVSYKQNPVVQLGNDTTLCEGVTKVLRLTNTNAVYQWQDGTSRDNFVVRQAGWYFVSANILGCSVSDSIHINYTPKPVFTLGRDTFVCKGQSILLSPSVNIVAAYAWQDGSNASFYNAADTGKYILTLTNECGTATSSVIISQGICQLYIPSAFSPNGDNLNDIFRLKYPFQVKKFKMVVYNKYGQKVFEAADMLSGWDGTYKGEQQPLGGYVWLISLTDIDGRDKTVKGTIMLVK